MSRIQFGWMVPMESQILLRHDFMDTVQQGLDIIVGNFDTVWLPDHLQFGERPFLESWTTLTYLAAFQPTLRYGHLVLCQLFRNPALLAKMAATLQYMSQGHFILGMGSGWNEDECKAYNIPFPSPGQRVDELEDTLRIIKALWREDNVTMEGHYHRVSHAFCQPKPDPLPPIMVAAMQPRMMRLTASYADWWNIGVQDLTQAREMVEALEQACYAVGRNPATLRRTAIISCCCALTEQKLKALMAKQTGHGSLRPVFIGTPERVVEQLLPLVELGFDYFIISAAGFPDFTTLEMMTYEVLPALNARVDLY